MQDIAQDIKTIETALLTLAGRCDGAVAQDDMGFNGGDAGFGHSLAKQVASGRQLSAKQLSTASRMLKKYASQLGFAIPTISADIMTTVAIASATPASNPKKIDMTPEGRLRLVFPYDASLVAQAKTVEGKQWNPDQRCWLYPPESKTIRALISAFPDFEVAPEIKQLLKKQDSLEQLRTVEAQEKIDFCVEYLTEHLTKTDVKPYDHQWSGALHIIDHERVIISDQPGLGKTFTSLMGAIALCAYYHIDKIIVICPVSLKTNWEREAKMMNTSVETYSDNIAAMKKIKITGDYVLIVDECHSMQNPSSQRTKKYKELATHPNCIGFINLSATPLKNGRPKNIYAVLNAIGHPVAQNRSAYDKRYCAGKRTSWGWDNSGASHLEELNAKISDVLLRRTKDECLDLPAKTHINIDYKLETDELRAFDNEVNTAAKEYWNAVDSGEKDERSFAVVNLGIHRRAASRAKIEEVKRRCDELIELGESVVLFTEFVETANILAEYYNTQPMTGEAKTTTRQTLIDEFQAGKTPVFIATTKAGGVGITLTRSSYLFIIDLPWTPGDFEQATDRVHRIGQDKKVTIFTMFAADVDYVVGAMMDIKNDNIRQVLKKNKIQTDKELSRDDIMRQFAKKYEM